MNRRTFITAASVAPVVACTPVSADPLREKLLLIVNELESVQDWQSLGVVGAKQHAADMIRGALGMEKPDVWFREIYHEQHESKPAWWA